MSEPVAIAIAIAIGLIAIAVAAAVFAVFPLLRQARETLRRLDNLIQSAEGDVRLTVAEVREAVQNLNQISGAVQKDMGKLSGTVESVERFGETLRNTNDIIRTTIHPRLLSFGALLVGLKTGSWYLLRKIFLKRR
ncbi:MAG: DUF948 domain-containing protein [Candidatus Methylomirabilales bacterium]